MSYAQEYRYAFYGHLEERPDETYFWINAIQLYLLLLDTSIYLLPSTSKAQSIT